MTRGRSPPPALASPRRGSAREIALLIRSIRWRRTLSVARKEMLHILRDPTTLFFTLFIPVIEMFMLGYAIDTNVRNVRTVFWDAAKTQES
ncbi:MAG TPA: hypothetical protein VNC50_01050, partial [Planctomycetia bacterium]|nr:hypothetical protein [Planctomycetia bacterium]